MSTSAGTDREVPPGPDPRTAGTDARTTGTDARPSGGSTAWALRRPRDWAWRRRIRSNKRSLQIYRTVVATLGLVVVAAGLALVPLPGPGWLIVFVGVSIWASEFHWARRLHRYGVRRVRAWNDWVQRQSIAVRAGLALGTCLFVNALMWLMLRLTGIPGWVPEQVASFMRTHLAL